MTFKISDPAVLPRIPQYDPAAGSEDLSASVDNLNPARKQRFGLSLSAPAPESEAEILNSPAHASHSLFGWPGERPGRFHMPARAPFDRLKFWRVQHELTHRLKPYQATDVSLMFRQASWGTILYWSQLLDGIEIEEPAHEMA